MRAWHENSKGIEETIQVHRAGQYDRLLSEHWDEFIESFIPSGIAHLFFFDAEQIQELAEGEHAAEILGTAIHTLLGLNIVDRLGDDLVTLERRKRSELRPGPAAEKIQHMQTECNRLQERRRGGCPTKSPTARCPRAFTKTAWRMRTKAF